MKAATSGRRAIKFIASSYVGSQYLVFEIPVS
jgi:hypothetical protein